MKNRGIKKSKAKERENLTWESAMVCLVLAIFIILTGSFYLYQVNDLATKGYEIRDIENQITQLKKDAQKMRIKEVELRSMYSLERTTQELGLVNANSISYLETDGALAMK